MAHGSKQTSNAKASKTASKIVDAFLQQIVMHVGSAQVSHKFKDKRKMDWYFEQIANAYWRSWKKLLAKINAKIYCNDALRLVNYMHHFLASELSQSHDSYQICNPMEFVPNAQK